jgi:acetylornithine deacetylase/succinyl-diaminopimelate desuccinylase-like protein
LATCDEEVGGVFGVEYMLKKVPALKNAAFVFSEGGFIKEEDGFVHAQISVSEKRLSQFVIKASGTGGHGSIPHNDIASEKVIRAAANILSYSWPVKPTPVASAYMKGVFENREKNRSGFRDLRSALSNKKLKAYIEKVPLYNALLKNTVTPTILKGGDKINVIPTESSISFDARLLPTEKHEKFFRKIKALAGKDVTVERVSDYTGKPAPSGYNSVYFRGIKKVIGHIAGNSVPVLPYITTGATDLRYFRDNGVTAYGFFPFVVPGDDILRMHGRNERISVDNVHRGLEGAYQIIRFLGSKDVP